jgi:hypothetical protein
VALSILVVAGSAAGDVILTVSCTADGLSTTQDFPIQCQQNVADWTLKSPCDITVQGVRLAQIKELSLQSDNEPYVNLHFSVEADNADLLFDISSAIVNFSPLPSPTAYASAGLTLTADANGATAAGAFDGGACYEARVDGGTFADLVPGFSTVNQSETHSDRLPAAGYEPISPSASSIQSEFKFTLTALEQASGTSRFEVVPEPVTLSLLGMCGLVLVRRRR